MPPLFPQITIHNEDVRINSLHDEETSWFNSRVKCFPLYTIMLACERTEYDLLSLGVQGHELEVSDPVASSRLTLSLNDSLFACRSCRRCPSTKSKSM